jgi:hypothetical protein
MPFLREDTRRARLDNDIPAGLGLLRRQGQLTNQEQSIDHQSSSLLEQSDCFMLNRR